MRRAARGAAASGRHAAVRGERRRSQTLVLGRSEARPRSQRSDTRPQGRSEERPSASVHGIRPARTRRRSAARRPHSETSCRGWIAAHAACWNGRHDRFRSGHSEAVWVLSPPLALTWPAALAGGSRRRARAQAAMRVRDRAPDRDSCDGSRLGRAGRSLRDVQARARIVVHDGCGRRASCGYAAGVRLSPGLYSGDVCSAYRRGVTALRVNSDLRCPGSQSTMRGSHPRRSRAWPNGPIA